MIPEIQEFFRELASQGINLTIFYDAFDFKRFVNGIGNTLTLIAVCSILSIILGAMGAAVLTLKNNQGFACAAIRGFIALFRNTPLIVQMYFFYFAIGSIMPTTTNAIGLPQPLVGGYTWAIISLSLYAASYNIETFRSGVSAVHKSYDEAAMALGFSKLQSFVYVTVPMAARFSFASLANNMVELTKSTTIAYAVGVAEVLYVSQQIWSDSLNTVEMMNVMLLIYLVLTGAVVFIINRVEKAMSLPGFGAGNG